MSQDVRKSIVTWQPARHGDGTLVILEYGLRPTVDKVPQARFALIGMVKVGG